MSALWTLLILAGLAYHFIQRNKSETEKARLWFQAEKSKEYIAALERHARREITSEELSAATAKFHK